MKGDYCLKHRACGDQEHKFTEVVVVRNFHQVMHGGEHMLSQMEEEREGERETVCAYKCEWVVCASACACVSARMRRKGQIETLKRDIF